MSNSKIIIVEGAQGVGKTTITDYLRHAMHYTNLYRLSGNSDSSKEGLKKATKMYKDLQQYMKTLENCNVNLLFDRTFLSEEIYCRLGYKDYKFTEVYDELIEELSKMDFEIYFIILYLKDEDMFANRLFRKEKGTPDYAKYAVKNSIDQQRAYLKLADEVQEKYPTIKVFKVENSKGLEKTKEELNKILKFRD